MFKPGDRIKCIDNNNCSFKLNLNESYIFLKYFENEAYLIIDEQNDTAYYSDRFILDQRYYRKQKLNNICLK